MLRLLRFAHDAVAFTVLARAVAHLAVLPNVPRPVLLYFVPPALAFLFLALNTGKFNATALAGCRLFLSMIAAAVLLGELSLVLPNLKPQFPGMPPQPDRVLTFYFGAYLIFFTIVCPGYILGTSLYWHVCGRPGRISWPILYAGCGCWLVAMGFLTLAITISDKLF